MLHTSLSAAEELNLTNLRGDINHAASLCGAVCILADGATQIASSTTSPSIKRGFESSFLYTSQGEMTGLFPHQIWSVNTNYIFILKEVT